LTPLIIDRKQIDDKTTLFLNPHFQPEMKSREAATLSAFGGIPQGLSLCNGWAAKAMSYVCKQGAKRNELDKIIHGYGRLVLMAGDYSQHLSNGMIFTFHCILCCSYVILPLSKVS